MKRLRNTWFGWWQLIALRKIARSSFARNGMSSRRKTKWRNLSRLSNTELALSPAIGRLLTTDGTGGTSVTSPGDHVPQQAIVEPARKFVGIEEIGRADTPAEAMLSERMHARGRRGGNCWRSAGGCSNRRAAGCSRDRCAMQPRPKRLRAASAADGAARRTGQGSARSRTV